MSSPSEGRPPAVLQVIPRLVSGGAERGTVELTEALAAAGWNAYVASAGGPLEHLISRSGGTHLTLPLASKNPLVMRRNVTALARVIRGLDIDIVHARSRAPAWSAWAAARATGRHFVTTFHNAYGVSSRLKHRYNSVMARGVRVIAISDFVAEHAGRVYGVGFDRLRTIPRGVDLDIFDPQQVTGARMANLAGQWRVPDGAPVVMLPGRLDPVEGRARFRRRDRRPRPPRHLLPDGRRRAAAGFRRELEAAIARHGLDELFRIVEDCRDMPAAYMLADVVVSASTDPEGFGRVIVEAQAMGRPVVATDHGGARETIVPDTTGWLAPAHDPLALGAAIGAALSLGPAERSLLARRAIAHIAAHFTRDADVCKNHRGL